MLKLENVTVGQTIKFVFNREVFTGEVTGIKPSNTPGINKYIIGEPIDSDGERWATSLWLYNGDEEEWKISSPD